MINHHRVRFERRDVADALVSGGNGDLQTGQTVPDAEKRNDRDATCVIRAGDSG